MVNLFTLLNSLFRNLFGKDSLLRRDTKDLEKSLLKVSIWDSPTVKFEIATLEKASKLEVSTCVEVRRTETKNQMSDIRLAEIDVHTSEVINLARPLGDNG